MCNSRNGWVQISDIMLENFVLMKFQQLRIGYLKKEEGWMIKNEVLHKSHNACLSLSWKSYFVVSVSF